MDSILKNFKRFDWTEDGMDWYKDGDYIHVEDVLKTLASKEAEIERLKAKLGEYANVFNWDADDNGIRRCWLEPDSSTPTAYNGFESARAALTQPTE